MRIIRRDNAHRDIEQYYGSEVATAPVRGWLIDEHLAAAKLAWRVSRRVLYRPAGDHFMRDEHIKRHAMAAAIQRRRVKISSANQYVFIAFPMVDVVLSRVFQ